MDFISRITAATDPQKIAQELTRDLNGTYQLGVLFTSHFDRAAIEKMVSHIREKGHVEYLIGCSCAGIIGSKEEIERKTATSLILSRLPGVKITPFTLHQAQLEGLQSPEDWYHFFEVFPSEKPIFVALPDPFRFDALHFVEQLNRVYPGSPVVGGLASGANSPGANTLILNHEFYDDGVVGVLLTGDIVVETVVSQGCRPIGKTYIVTKADENYIYSLAGRPCPDVLKDELGKLSPEDQMLAQEAVFVGIAMDEYKHDLRRGDFLIRGLMGIDPITGAGVIADTVKTGQTIQFHLRDAKTAREDLNELLSRQQTRMNQRKPNGALVFCCNGRGEYLFKEKNHDIQIIQKYLGVIPTAGFFCAGEIGPVGKSNFLHGFTNSIALFYPKGEASSES